MNWQENALGLSNSQRWPTLPSHHAFSWVNAINRAIVRLGPMLVSTVSFCAHIFTRHTLPGLHASGPRLCSRELQLVLVALTVGNQARTLCLTTLAI